jgi:hypothetical protein
MNRPLCKAPVEVKIVEPCYTQKIVRTQKPAITKALLSTVLALALCLTSAVGWAQPKSGLRLPEPVDPVKAAREGKALVAELLSQLPESESRTSGMLRTRERRGKTTAYKVFFSVAPSGTNVISRYVARDESPTPFAELTIIQALGFPNRYFLSTRGEPANPISGAQLMHPFAESEFWIADLGLEFLYWPNQMVTGQEMKRGQWCEILESRPVDLVHGYSKVVSWIASSQKPGIVIVQADAYDHNGRLLKQFSPKKLQRVEKQWQLQQMEMLNRQTGTRSTIDFDLGVPAR